jgi:hypothetical protein
VSARRGQTIVDMLLLVLALSIVLVTLTFTIGQEAQRAQGLRFASAQHQLSLVTAMNKQLALGSTPPAHGRAVDLLVFRACEGCPAGDYCPELDKAINKTFALLAEGRHYIFAANGTINATTNKTTIFDKQATVCLDRIPVARIDLNTYCGNFQAVYGTWPDWESPPEAC